MSLAEGEPTIFEDIEMEYSVERILETPPFPRWKGSTHSGEELQATVNRLQKKVLSALAPRGMYRPIPVDRAPFDEYNPPARLLAGEYVVPGVVTIGTGLHETEGSDSLLDGLVIDAMENVALQFARTTLITEIRDSATSAGLNTTRVFPPGTRGSDWALEDRSVIFDHLPTARIDVYLHNDRVTVPRKTFTFAMGLGEGIAQADLLLSCADCEYIEECAYVGTAIT